MKVEGIINHKPAPIIEITLDGIKVEVVLDTGFNGELMLSGPKIKRLGLEWVGKEDYFVASGERKTTDVYKGCLDWFGKKRIVAVMATRSKDSLLGMGLLGFCRVEINVPAKRVVIEAIC